MQTVRNRGLSSTIVGSRNANYKRETFHDFAGALYHSDDKLKTYGEIVATLKQLTDTDVPWQLDQFTAYLKRVFEYDGTKGFYSNEFNVFTRIVLTEYERSLRTSNNGLAVADINKLSDIEHILPQTWSSVSDWKNQFANYSALQIDQLAGTLGNLMMSTKKMNSALNNKPFIDKKDIYVNHDDKTCASFEVAANDDWTVDKINARSTKIVDFIATRWNLTISNDIKSKLIAPWK